MDARSPSLPPDSLPEALASAAGWRADAAAGVQRSLPEVYGTISVPLGGHWWSKLLAFAGPGYLISVGYMDPGNWATDLAGGSKFGYTLLSVVLLSNLIAILLQGLASKLGIVTGRDLAQACRDHYSRPASLFLWVICEIAIAACDLAEVIGSAIALNLLFGIFIARPSLGAVATGFVPVASILRGPDQLYIAIGILGATVMPHNLYLHSSVVQTRRYEETPAGKRGAVRYAFI